MRLRLLSQRNFRNLAFESFRPPGGLLAVVGGNAQGKTSLLWAIHLALGGEAGGGLADLIRWGAEGAWLAAEVETEAGVFRVEQRLLAGGRRVFLGGREVPFHALWELPGSVLVAPEDLEVVLGSKEGRRAFLDRLLSRFSRRYAWLLAAYERALRQRNALLRGGGGELAPWDQELHRYGGEIMALRRRFLARLTPLFQEVARALGLPSVGLRLEETAPQGLLPALAQTREEEALRGQTLVGPHRDDLRFLLEGRPAKPFASRGQAKALALALRLAEHRLLAERHGEPPLLLLDEWGEGLDMAHQKALLAYMEGLPQAILAGLKPPPGLPVCWMEGGVVLCPDG